METGISAGNKVTTSYKLASAQAGDVLSRIFWTACGAEGIFEVAM